MKSIHWKIAMIQSKTDRILPNLICLILSMDPAHFPGTLRDTLWVGVLSRSAVKAFHFHNFLIIFGSKYSKNIIDFTVASFQDTLASFHVIVPVAVETQRACCHCPPSPRARLHPPSTPFELNEHCSSAPIMWKIGRATPQTSLEILLPSIEHIERASEESSCRKNVAIQ